MNDLIEREDFFNALEDYRRNNSMMELIHWNAIKTILFNISSVKIKKNKGKWVYDDAYILPNGLSYHQYYCSECGQTQINNFQNFCPNCGAEMQ